MDVFKSVLVVFVAIEHLGFFFFETVLYQRPIGRAIFRVDERTAEITKAWAANQGLYNGFLAAGLAYSLLTSNPEIAFALQVYVLSCAMIAGAFGAATVSKRIFVIQTVPSALGLAAVLFF